MRSVFELVNVDKKVFGDFIENTNFEMDKVTNLIKDGATENPRKLLADAYQSVHAVKSEAAILGLATFAEKVHELETTIKKIQDQKEISFDDMLHFTLEMEKLVQEKEKFEENIGKINAFKTQDDNQDVVQAKSKDDKDVLVETLDLAVKKVAADLGKKVRFAVDGVNTGILDKAPRRVIKECLMQLARNSVYHGIETPEDRVAAGKKDTGTIYLTMAQEDGKLHIKLQDDGSGINADKIRKKAEEKGLIQPGEEVPNSKLIQYIFMAGFSTSETENLHAGRGVGLDLVNDRIKEAGGTLRIQTSPGKGTAFHLFLPYGA
jgi:chemotaxis protein histidine kinase CheA